MTVMQTPRNLPDGDWVRLRKYIAELYSLQLGPDSTPTFATVDIDGALDVEGNATFGSSLSVTDDLNVGGTLTVVSEADFGDNVTVDGTLSVVGNADFAANVSVAGDLDMSGALTVASIANLGDDVFVDGLLSVDGNAYFGTDLSVAGDVDISGTMTLASVANFGDEVIVDGSMSVAGTLTIGSDVSFGGGMTVASTLTVNSDLSVGGGLAVASTTLIENCLGAGYISGTDYILGVDCASHYVYVKNTNNPTLFFVELSGPDSGAIRYDGGYDEMKIENCTTVASVFRCDGTSEFLSKMRVERTGSLECLEVRHNQSTGGTQQSRSFRGRLYLDPAGANTGNRHVLFDCGVWFNNDGGAFSATGALIANKCTYFAGNGSGNLGTGCCFYAEYNNDTDFAGTITDFYLFYGTNTGTSTDDITNNYGIYLESITEGTNKYAIYTNDGDISLGDDVLHRDTSRDYYYDFNSSIYDDGTNLNIITDDDLEIDCGANKTLELQQSVYKDINFNVAVFSQPASTIPDEVQLVDEGGNNTGIYSYGFDVGEEVSGSFELQHDYKEGTDLTFHLHWQGNDAPTGTDKVQWQLKYTVAQDGQTLDAPTTITVETDYDTQYEWVRSDFTAITGTNYNIGDQFLFTLERIAASADEYGGDAIVATVGVHYEIDTMGSRQIGTK